MNERAAELLALSWRGSGGLVPRGPRWLLGWGPADAQDVRRHTGFDPDDDGGVWRLQLGGRFLQSGGLVYPGGIPFPDDLAGEVAVVSNEVWLYVDAAQSMVGHYWWPEAVRKPVASPPRADFRDRDLITLDEARVRLGMKLPLGPGWEPGPAVRMPGGGVLVMLACGRVPDPVNEMLLYEYGGLSLRATPSSRAPELDELVAAASPPFRRVSVDGLPAAGRECGRTLGPHTWPWPAELIWWDDGVTYEMKGAVGLDVLQSTAAGSG